MRNLYLLSGLIAAPALAVPTAVTPFDIALPGTTSAAEPTLAGVAISDTLVPFAAGSGATGVSGTLQVRVVRAKDNSLAFYWKINSAPASKGSVSAIFISGFPNVPYDANWRQDGLGTVAPTALSGGLAGNLSWVYGFYFKTPIKPGESSRFFFMRGKATATTPSTARIQTSGDVTPELAILAPKS